MVPLIFVSLGLIWVTIIALHVVQPDWSATYLNWIDVEFLTTTADTTFFEYILIFIAIAVMAPLVEEIIFRGDYSGATWVQVWLCQSGVFLIPGIRAFSCRYHRGVYFWSGAMDNLS